MTILNIHGICAAEFSKVKDAFIANFEERGEIGARVSLVRDGETLVDLWGGYCDAERTQAWQDDTLVCTMSVTKGIVAMAAHLLADRGKLDYEAPVADYWPDFAQDGKEGITVRQAISHQASLAIIDEAESGDILDWDLFCSKIAAQRPNWPPATNETYHSMTIGHITGELVRRIDGRAIDRFIAEELAEPLGADYILGCEEGDLARIALHIHNPKNTLMNGGLINERTMAMFAPLPADPSFHTSKEQYRHVLPSGGGVAHALALARLFLPLANEGYVAGRHYFKQETLAAASQQQWHHEDSLFGTDFRVAMGLLLHIPFNHFGREGNIGSAGAGGYTAFADPEHRFAFGYTPVRFTSGEGMGIESRALVDAVYASL